MLIIMRPIPILIIMRLIPILIIMTDTNTDNNGLIPIQLVHIILCLNILPAPIAKNEVSFLDGLCSND